LSVARRRLGLAVTVVLTIALVFGFALAGQHMQKQPSLARRVAKRLRPRSRNGRRLKREVRASAFAARVALSTRVLQTFVAQNS
jgi:hypothetical protein